MPVTRSRRVARQAMMVFAWIVAAAVPARAQSTSNEMSPEEAKKFFVDKSEDDATVGKTLWQGSLTSTTFLHQEAADKAQPLEGRMEGTENASPIGRFFTDLRGQVDARHISGGRWDMRLDTRFRFAPPAGRSNPTVDYGTEPQSGAFGGNEYDVRELYVVRAGDRTDLFLGRQFVLDLAGIKIDGARLDYALSQRWTLLGVAGLYPVKGSRSVTTDYPIGVDAMGKDTTPVLPIVAGAAGAYRTSTIYGAIGAAGILPLAADAVTNKAEPPRVFLSSNGYWRAGLRLDVYHYLVLDVAGSAGFALTNGSIGLNWKPQQRLRVTAAVHRVDTETLNAQAQTQFEDPKPIDGQVQNSVQVLRIATDTVRAGASLSLGATQRFELSTWAAFRRRGDIALPAGNGDPVILPASQAVELSLQAVDRSSILGLRMTASVSRFFGLDDNNLNQSDSFVARLLASRGFAGERGQWDLDVGYLQSNDEIVGEACDPTTILTCYGRSSMRSLSLGTLLYYRFADAWYAQASVAAANESLVVADGEKLVGQPPILSVSGFLRIAFRF